MLVRLEHSSLDAPVLLASGSTHFLGTDPLRLGVRRTEAGQEVEYELVLLSIMRPDDEEDTPRATQLIFENVVSDMVSLVRDIPPNDPVEITLTLIMSSSPNVTEVEFGDFIGMSAEWNEDQISLQISREPITMEACPAHRMTISRCPGLFR